LVTVEVELMTEEHTLMMLFGQTGLGVEHSLRKNTERASELPPRFQSGKKW
jgi:hypothetical protein